MDEKKEIKKFDFNSDDLRTYCATIALLKVINLTFTEMAEIDTLEAFWSLFETTKGLAEQYGLDLEKEMSAAQKRLETEYGYVVQDI